MQETSKMTQSKGKKVDAIHCPRIIPRWVMDLAENEKGTEPCFIMAKKLTKTDLNRQQNRLLIPSGFVDAHLIPFLSDEEKAAASLLDDGRKRKKPSSRAKEPKKIKPAGSGGGAVEEHAHGEAAKDDKKKKEAGRKHGGLPVSVHVGAGGWKAYVTMARWDSSNGTVLKGGEYSRYVAKWSGVEVGEEVELWGFREGRRGSPYFVLHRKESN